MFYLWDGTGNPWAGHRSLIFLYEKVDMPMRFSKFGNFGLTLPTGSVHFKIMFFLLFKKGYNSIKSFVLR